MEIVAKTKPAPHMSLLPPLLTAFAACSPLNGQKPLSTAVMHWQCHKTGNIYLRLCFICLDQRREIWFFSKKEKLQFLKGEKKKLLLMFSVIIDHRDVLV